MPLFDKLIQFLALKLCSDKFLVQLIVKNINAFAFQQNKGGFILEGSIPTNSANVSPIQAPTEYNGIIESLFQVSNFTLIRHFAT